jgi:valyl-tRNA synthetase
MLSRLSEVVETATKAFSNYDHTKALEVTESFFWTFTDDYLELVKDRAYGQQDHSPEQIGSAVLALRSALSVLVRLFAPFLPFASEEVWSWWQEGSTADELPRSSSDLMNVASEALILIRKSKSDLKVSMKAEIDYLELAGPTSLSQIARDLQSVGNILKLKLKEADQISISEIRFTNAE